MNSLEKRATARAGSGRWQFRHFAGLLGMALLAGCQAPLPPTSSGTTQPASPVEEAASVPTQSVALTVDGYKREVARAIYRSSPEHLFEGAPPPLLRAVVVLSLRIDREGKLSRVSVLRSNGYRELEAIALSSVHRASPLPMPNRLVEHNGNAEFVETWLFRDDGRFQIRSLAEAQALLQD
jgi:periplasmic protein TonB